MTDIKPNPELDNGPAEAEVLPIVLESEVVASLKEDGVTLKGKRPAEEEAEGESKKVKTEAVEDVVVSNADTAAVTEDAGTPVVASKPEEKLPAEPVQLGPKLFKTSVEMFQFFHDLCHGFTKNVDLNEVTFFLKTMALRGLPFCKTMECSQRSHIIVSVTTISVAFPCWLTTKRLFIS